LGVPSSSSIKIRMDLKYVGLWVFADDLYGILCLDTEKDAQ
jgi:hypothetical protein